MHVPTTLPQRSQSTILGLTVASAAKSTSPPVGRRARVLVVDDSPSFLALLGDVIRATARLEAVGEALSGEQAVELAQALRPDMALIDVRMPGLGGIEAARYIKTSDPSIVVALISTTRPDELPPEAYEVGADAVIWKSDLDPATLDQTWHRYRGRPA
jgi:two-component system, NarL family, invasion response regulator UvrY